VDQWTNEKIYVKSGYDILEKRSKVRFERYIIDKGTYRRASAALSYKIFRLFIIKDYDKVILKAITWRQSFDGVAGIRPLRT